jgi:hypothetical protein
MTPDFGTTIAFALMFISAIFLSLGLFYLHIVGIYNSFKAHFAYGILSIFLGPFGIAVGAVKVFTGENILLRKKK